MSTVTQSANWPSPHHSPSPLDKCWPASGRLGGHVHASQPRASKESASLGRGRRAQLEYVHLYSSAATATNHPRSSLNYPSLPLVITASSGANKISHRKRLLDAPRGSVRPAHV
jgi:hypothetical protein